MIYYLEYKEAVIDDILPGSIRRFLLMIYYLEYSSITASLYSR